MPQVGQDIEYARIIEWHVQEGEQIHKGDTLATVESDKASFEVESSSDGTVLKILFSEGEEAPVFQPIIYIGTVGEKLDLNQPEMISVSDKKTVSVDNQTKIRHNNKNKLFSSPSARRVARENNLDISEIQGSGPQGRIVKADILKDIELLRRSNRITPLAKNIAQKEHIDVHSIPGSGTNNRIVKGDIEALFAPKKSAPLLPESSDKIVRFTRTRQRIADRLTLSKQTIPHFYLFTDIDFTNTLFWRNQLNLQNEAKISVNDIILKSTADALSQFPELNAHVDNEKALIKSRINLGIAVSTPHGLLVPVIPEANMLSVSEIHIVAKNNAEKAQRGIVNPTAPATFTVSNLGMYGINRFLPVINPPECAILSVGSIEKKVAVVNNEVAIIESFTLGIACDHRAVDGAYAAEFLAALKKKLENFSNQ